MIKRLQVDDKVYVISTLDDIYVDLHITEKKGGKVIRSDRFSLRDLLVLLDLAKSERKGSQNNPFIRNLKRGE